MNTGKEKRLSDDSESPIQSASSLKEGGKMCQIREQILRDDVTGITFQFEVDQDGDTRIRLYGESLMFGNRELGFEDGKFSFAGTSVAGDCKPAWVTNIDDL